jgi:uncharacterized protein YutE (UPF0331/DUF86 family)
MRWTRRNIVGLAHLYGEVDDKRVHEILENELNSFRMFLIESDAVLERERKKKKGKK